MDRFTALVIRGRALMELIKSEQMSLFGAPAGRGGGGGGGDKPKKPLPPKAPSQRQAPQKPKTTVKPPQAAQKPPGAGWEPIPGGKHGGYRRRKASGGHDYWYPDVQGYAAEARAAEEQAPEVEGPPEPPPEQASTEYSLGTVKFRGKESEEKLRAAIEAALTARKAPKGILKYLKVTHIEDVERRKVQVTRYEFGDEVTTWVTQPAHTRWRIEIEYDPAIPGHTPIAHYDNGRVTVFHEQKTMTREDYEKAKIGHCDVCKTNRRRNQIFIVERDADGKHIHVGGECAKKFHGHDLIKDAAMFDSMSKWWKSALSSLDDIDEERGGGGGGSPVADPIEFLGAVKAIIDQPGGGYYKGIAMDALSIMYPSPQARTAEEREHKKHMESEARKAQKQIEKDFPAIKQWIIDTYEADNKRGKFNEFFASLHGILVERDYLEARDFGRVAWVAKGFYEAEWKKRQEKDRPEAKSYTPPEGVGEGKLHDLPGDWTIIRTGIKDSDWGTFLWAVAQNDKGETLWFKVSNPQKWHDHHHKQTGDMSTELQGKTFKMRGKVKGYGKDGDITFMKNMNPRLEKKKAEKEKAEKTAAAKERKKTYDAWKKKAAEPDFWKTSKETIQKLDISDQANRKLMDLHSDSLEAAIKRDESEALEAALGGSGDSRFNELRATIKSTEPGSPSDSYWQRDRNVKMETAANVANQFPNLEHRIKTTVHVQNPWLERDRQRWSEERSEARREWQENLHPFYRSKSYGYDIDTVRRAQKEGGYTYRDHDGTIKTIPAPPPQPSDDPIDAGRNFTGVKSTVLYGHALTGLEAFGVNMREVMPLDELRAVRDHIRESNAKVTKLAEDEKSGLDYIAARRRKDSRRRIAHDVYEVLNKYNSYTDNHATLEDVKNAISKRAKSSAEYAEKTEDEDEQHLSRVVARELEAINARIAEMEAVAEHRYESDSDNLRIEEHMRDIEEEHGLRPMKKGMSVMGNLFKSMVNRGLELLKAKPIAGQTGFGFAHAPGGGGGGKTGEGSRGGKIVGHTKGGKPIYESQGKAEEHGKIAKHYRDLKEKYPVPDEHRKRAQEAHVSARYHHRTNHEHAEAKTKIAAAAGRMHHAAMRNYHEKEIDFHSRKFNELHTSSDEKKIKRADAHREAMDKHSHAAMVHGQIADGPEQNNLSSIKRADDLSEKADAHGQKARHLDSADYHREQSMHIRAMADHPANRGNNKQHIKAAEAHERAAEAHEKAGKSAKFGRTPSFEAAVTASRVADKHTEKIGQADKKRAAEEEQKRPTGSGYNHHKKMESYHRRMMKKTKGETRSDHHYAAIQHKKAKDLHERLEWARERGEANVEKFADEVHLSSRDANYSSAKAHGHTHAEAALSANKTMRKSMDGKPVAAQPEPPEVQEPPEKSEADREVERFMTANEIYDEGLPFGLRTEPAGGELMAKGDAPGVGLDPPPGAAYSSFDLNSYGVGTLSQPDGNGGLDEDEEPGEKFDGPEVVVTRAIPNSPMVFGRSR